MNQNSNQDTVMDKQNEAYQWPDLPPGLVFRPSPPELLYSLFKKLTGELVLYHGEIIEFDVDKVDPDQLPYSIGQERGYFFAPSKNRNARRDTPSGYWKLNKEKVTVLDNSRSIVIGFMDKLSFYIDDTETEWKMTQYRCNLEGIDQVEEKYIACEVLFKVKEKFFDWRLDDSEEEDSDDECFSQYIGLSDVA